MGRMGESVQEEAPRPEEEERAAPQAPPPVGPAGDAAPSPQAEPQGEDPQERAQRLAEELAALEDTHRRLLADFANYRRRMAKEQAQWERRAKGELITRLLPVWDGMERAVAHAQQDTAKLEDLRQGLAMVVRQWEEVLTQEGIERVGAEGESFDPAVHEALSQEERDDVPAGTVVAVYAPGYRMGEQLLRPARVRVAVSSPKAAPSPSSPPPEG